MAPFFAPQLKTGRSPSRDAASDPTSVNTSAIVQSSDRLVGGDDQRSIHRRFGSDAGHLAAGVEFIPGALGLKVFIVILWFAHVGWCDVHTEAAFGE